MRNSAGLTGCSRARGPCTAGRSYCAGIRVSGKLRCLTTLPRAATIRILRATGIEAETELAFAGLYSLLHPLADELSALPETRAAALRSALGLESGGAAPEPFAVAAATHGLLTAAAESNALLLLVDDLHWLDRESQDALMFALRRLGRDAIASVLTLRAGQPAPAGVRSCELTGLEPSQRGCSWRRSPASGRPPRWPSGCTPRPAATRSR
jgi:hypothetical protein